MAVLAPAVVETLMEDNDVRLDLEDRPTLEALPTENAPEDWNCTWP
jgi:hypothetical protein